MVDLGAGTAAVRVLLLRTAPNTRQGQPLEPKLDPARLQDEVRRQGRNLRLLVPSDEVHDFTALKLVEAVNELPADGVPRPTMLMRIAGGPTVRRLTKEPALEWARDGNNVQLLWTDRFSIEDADKAWVFEN